MKNLHHEISRVKLFGVVDYYNNAVFTNPLSFPKLVSKKELTFSYACQDECVVYDVYLSIFILEILNLKHNYLYSLDTRLQVLKSKIRSFTP